MAFNRSVAASVIFVLHLCLWMRLYVLHTRMQVTCSSSLASRCHQRSPVCLIGYHDSAHRKMARRISPLDLHSPAFSFPRHQGHIWLLLSLCSCFVPISPLHSHYTPWPTKCAPSCKCVHFFPTTGCTTLPNPDGFTSLFVPLTGKVFRPFFLPSCCLLSACVSNREHAPSQIHQSKEIKKNKKKTRQRKQSFLS